MNYMLKALQDRQKFFLSALFHLSALNKDRGHHGLQGSHFWKIENLDKFDS